ncbi:arylsulfatase [Acinetobacter gerneri]|uniref:arylsulfatase n=1 Tax=Acinetobacter gerneri TaxID=202952 RepID=UPI003A865117
MKTKQHFKFLFATLISTQLVACNDSKDQQTNAAETAKAPNVLFIMADDLGYSDLGAFGGEIHTPNLDALATQGRIFTDYHTAPTCSPTRSQLISGTDHHLAGIGAMAELTPDNFKGQPGYEGYLNNRSLSIAEVLKDNGYHTYMAGKWHLGLTAETNAAARGFERSFTLLQGLDLHFKQNPSQYNRAAQATYTEDGKVIPISDLPDDFYSSNYYADKIIHYIDSNRNDGKPFFAYAAFTAPHWPLQAPAEYSDRYKGKYDAGYDVIRNARLERQKQLGIIPADFKAANPVTTASAPQQYGHWNELTADQKAIEARKMEVYAGMVENLDANIGRIISYLKANKLYDNTLIFFVSDNGAEGFIRGQYGASQGFDNSLKNIGTSSSYQFIGPRWAEVSETPFHLWKDTAGEGATSVPAIVKLPNQSQSAPTYRGFASVLDVFPTVLQFAGITVPEKQYHGREINTPSGVSWKNLLENKNSSIRAEDFIFADELHASKYVKSGEWKIAHQGKSNLANGTEQWELYNLKNDRGETTNLATLYPEKVQALAKLYQKYAQANGVLEYPQR